MTDIRIKRAYRAARVSDGERVLVDRFWPRGLAKDRVRLSVWMKDLSPSDALRRWFDHDPANWPEFQRRYGAELDARPDDIATLVALVNAGPVTLVYGAKDEEHNNAAALHTYLLNRIGEQ
jgi:uncharacterized protein YeaO (DUF488 family)